MTPKHRLHMISQVTAECNRVINLYKKNNPDFNGKISIYGHSLGSILTYDMLTREENAKPASERVKGSADKNDLTLEFDVNQFFGINW
jgi:hypothetical protein